MISSVRRSTDRKTVAFSLVINSSGRQNIALILLIVTACSLICDVESSVGDKLGRYSNWTVCFCPSAHTLHSD